METYEDFRISKLREYLIDIIREIKEGDNFQINADMLALEENNYSLDKIPTQSTVETWITGPRINRDVFSFRSRFGYSQDVINNLVNVGFFEKFEAIIFNKNRNKILPDIKGIQKISCLNCGTMAVGNTNTSEFQIQIQIDYILE